MTRVEKYYLVTRGEKVVLEDDDTVSVIVEAYKESEEEPVRLILNLGDDKDDIIELLKRIAIQVELLKG